MRVWICIWLIGSIQLLPGIERMDVRTLAPDWDCKSPKFKSCNLISESTDMVFLTIFGSFEYLQYFTLIIQFK